MLDEFLKHWIWYSVVVLFVFYAIISWHGAARDRDMYLAETHRYIDSHHYHIQWTREYNEMIPKMDYCQALQMLGNDDIDSQLRESFVCSLSREGKRITFNSILLWQKAFELSSKITTTQPSSNLTRILKENFAGWLVEEVKMFPDAHFSFVTDRLNLLEDNYIHSEDWHVAGKELIILAAQRARNQDELNRLYKYVIKNLRGREIYPVLIARSNELYKELGTTQPVSTEIMA